MVVVSPWLKEYWFDLVQTLGIVGGLWFTGAAFCREVRARKMADYLTLVGHHRELWIDAHRRPELARMFTLEVDLVAAPISVMEEEFLNLVIVHFSTGWLMAQQDGLVDKALLKADARAFFSLPIPRVVWERTTHFRDPKFVEFIATALRDTTTNPIEWSVLSRCFRGLKWMAGLLCDADHSRN